MNNEYQLSPLGSLPRTASVLEHYDTNPDNPPPTSVLEASVEETMRRQVELGITYVGDGEMSKPSYVSYVAQRLTGFKGSALRPGWHCRSDGFSRVF